MSDSLNTPLQPASQKAATEHLILETLFEVLPSGVICLDETGHILQMNHRAKEILALGAQACHPQWPEHLQTWFQTLQEATQEISRGEVSLQFPEQPEVSTVGFSMQLRRQSDESLLKVIIFTDITQVLKERATLSKIQEELSQSQKLASLGTMVAGVAHEMNNPLMGISISTSLLRMNLERLQKLSPEQVSQHLASSLEKGLQEIQKITQGSQKASVLVNDLLAYAKPPQMILEVIPLHAFVQEIIHALKNHPNFSHFHFEIAEAPAHRILTDRVKLEQVFYNLFKNACDATDGQGTVNIFYETRLDENNKTWLITRVCDNGPGIEPGKLHQIFDPFFTTKGHCGVGLGLSICYRSIEQLGGLLSAQNQPHGGAEFLVTLPLYLEEAHSSERLL